MKVSLRRNLFNSTILAGILLFLAASLAADSTYLLILTAAQIVFVPLMLREIIVVGRKYTLLIWIGMISIALWHILSSDPWKTVCAAIYLLFTLTVAMSGLRRFFNRGFVNLAEFSIDMGMMYLFIGGLWFFAFAAHVETGFSPLINWLTAIHFHYSAFLLPVSLGLFGRLHDSKLYRGIVPLILAGPMLVAIGITFWPILELLSVLVYIFALYSLIILAYRTRFPARLQGVLIRLSYSALGVTILFSMLYAAGGSLGGYRVSVDFMLAFHGFVNCVCFGLFGVLGWCIAVPPARLVNWSFPVSKIRGKLTQTGSPVQGLVDDMALFVDTSVLPRTITHFYEHTDQYRLFASVKWSPWFKPFAVIYKLISRQTQQLNLPLSGKRTEMTGEITAVDSLADGRHRPRAWVRKVRNQTVFTAIYSQHETAGKAYMNIALPLPFSTMIGILELKEKDKSLILSSRGEGDPGIYFAVGGSLFRLPLSEHFQIEEKQAGMLGAHHKMKIFGVSFLEIHYHIEHK
ncbi:YndJ family protein [Peribacillus sp. SCS-37]|uniref:YndJ family protein n=1 Tax=Paraperibacillus esterisolvens TaxID=3115296 RepID=UPI00390672AC